MKTAVKNKEQSLVNDAFQVLLKNLGPKKTADLWRVFTTSKTEYLELRKKIFEGKNIDSIFEEAEKFNRTR